MPTKRTAKIQAEIDKARAKLAEQQSRIRGLEAKRTELENDEIVEIVREFNIPLESLADFLRSARNGAHLPFANISGKPGPKSKTAPSEKNGGRDGNSE